MFLRQLGIPTVQDRIVQQAMAQLLTQLYEPKFSKSSFGFRPRRSAHHALAKASEYIREGRGYVPARELCRKHAISDATFYTWRKKYGGMEVPEVKRLKSLEEENARLKKLLAEAMLDKEALQVALGRKY